MSVQLSDAALFTRAETVGPAGTACRICGDATRVVLDLGATPLANALPLRADAAVPRFPLALEACQCGNLQIGYCVDAETLYAEYLYVTPSSTMLDAHYLRLERALRSRGFLHDASRVLEIGSNVGTFLHFLRPRVARVIGVDPARNICEIAIANGVPTICAFFDRSSAAQASAEIGAPDIVFARHCLAHNSEPYTMLEGAVSVLAPGGSVVVENAYGAKTIDGLEFDQIYHEHMFYFTVHAVARMFERVGLRLIDIVPSPIHGGSLAFIGRRTSEVSAVSADVTAMLREERATLSDAALIRFRERTAVTVERLRHVLEGLHAGGKRVFAYGATAKGSTLLNVVGDAARTIAACADSTPIKQGRFVPGAGIRIIPETQALADPPDVFVLTAWNFRDELIAKVRATGNQRTGFIVPIPSVEVIAGDAVTP